LHLPLISFVKTPLGVKLLQRFADEVCNKLHLFFWQFGLFAFPECWHFVVYLSKCTCRCIGNKAD